MQTENTANIINSLLQNREFILRLRSQVLRPQQTNEIIGKLVEEIKQVLIDIIHYQLQNQLKDLIEDNNKILKEIQSSMMKRDTGESLQEMSEEMSFTEVHKLMNEERQRIQDQINDASLDKSISAFVELKVETIEERVITIDKRLKGMEDKYETNLNSIWNVLSITESAIFDHLKQTKDKKCKEKQPMKINNQNQNQKEKSSVFGFFKFGSK